MHSTNQAPRDQAVEKTARGQRENLDKFPGCQDSELRLFHQGIRAAYSVELVLELLRLPRQNNHWCYLKKTWAFALLVQLVLILVVALAGDLLYQQLSRANST